MIELPKRIERLQELANNLFWVWTPKFRDLFKRLDHPSWVATGHNPVHMLQTIPAERLLSRSKNPSFLKRFDSVLYDYDRYLKDKDKTWFSLNYPEFKDNKVAYISTEYGLHQSLPIYSGGLGILSGDHAKESSDLGVPLIGVGFVYPQGYFKQIMPRTGWQQVEYEDIEFEHTPINPVRENGEDQLILELRCPDSIYLRVWTLKVGRTPLFLMDTDIEKNQPWNRGLSARLYGGDQEMRIRQEIVLGLGSVRILSMLGYNPSIYHLNEGHTAFAALELIRKEMTDNGKEFAEAVNIVRKKIIFTTHTPVPAGHDQFPFELVSKYFQNFWEELGISHDEFLSLGAFDWGHGQGSRFNMTALGIRLSHHQNAVSNLNGEICRNMWVKLFSTPEFKNRPPIQHVTNGVHVPTWTSGPFQKLYTKYIGKKWLSSHDDPSIWEAIDDIPNDVLWRTRSEVRERMFSFLRERARLKRVREGKDSRQTLAAGSLLDPNTLTIGFARRFATYKRSNLIFQDIQRISKSLLDPYTPVQIIFAGKAHPADDPGKNILQQIYQKAIDPALGGRICFIEDYDMQVARYLVQGCDVWLNTPLRPQEASGTSGMKSALNGGIIFSILDGWWPEAYDASNGWIIGGEQYMNQEEQNQRDATDMYEILDNEIRPLFYQRNGEGIPEDWLDVVRNSIKSIAPTFSARRMLKEYVNLYFQ